MIDFVDVSKQYTTGQTKIQALKDINFRIESGRFAVILGASGAGKSTILNLLGGMDTVTSGKICVDGNDITACDEKSLTAYRGRSVGFVFQFYNLIPNLTALENVAFAAEFAKTPLPAAKVLSLVGMESRRDHFPAQLSGGEQQRVAIARAIAKNPDLLLCDEPTGALDYETGKSILKLLQDINRNQKKTVVLITHNTAIAGMADLIIKVKSGCVESIAHNQDPQPAERIEW